MSDIGKMTKHLSQLWLYAIADKVMILDIVVINTNSWSYLLLSSAKYFLIKRQSSFV